jgi:hypothetical protein
MIGRDRVNDARFERHRQSQSIPLGQHPLACCPYASGYCVCQKDLTSRPDDPSWRSYCPNAITLGSQYKKEA